MVDRREYPSGRISPASVQGLIDDAIEALELGGDLDFVAFTAPVNVTATVEANANPIVTATPVVYDGSTPVWIEFSAVGIQTPTGGAGRSLLLWLFDGETSLGTLGLALIPVSGTMVLPTLCRRRLTPSAASHTYSVRGTVSAGTGIISAGTGVAGADGPGYIRTTPA